MKYLTIEHMNKLDALKEEAFLEKCVANLIEIDYIKPFPKNKNEYSTFVKHTFEICKKHGLSNKKHAFSLMLLWHIKGDEITKEDEFMHVLETEDMSVHKKSDYFNAYIDEILEKEEEKQI